ncbi:MFS transporter [Pseudactinotalea sp. HY158]|uniref:MFS transporter n=1 Tax=Pseudactinotalea sp. HY158 TaxID=2654547 RepID=UPI001E2F62B4|nr:MFS transporter [Pseudactinotalea sp. HY158]
MPTESDFVPDPRRWRVLAVLVVALFMSLVGVSIVNVALPSIQAGLEADQSELQWVLSGYALTFGIGLVTAGRAGDLYGRGPLFIAGVALFTAASVASGLAQDALTLNVARAVQGVGSGLLNPQAVGMIQDHFRGAERGRAFGVFGSAVGVSVAVGPLLGGLLIEAGGITDGWRWTFFVNVPVGILAIALALAWFPRPLLDRAGPDRGDGGDAGSSGGRRSRDLDPVGAILLGLAVLAVLLPFVEGGTAPAWIWLALPAGAGLTAAWLRWERRQKRRGRHPMVNLAIFRVRSFANGSLLITLYFMGITSVWVLVALYMQDGLGHTALESGFVGLPSAICSAVAAAWGGRNVMRHGRKVVIGGMYFALVGLVASMAVVWLQGQGRASEWWLLLTLAFVGIAQGSVISPNQTLTLADVPLEYAGSSGGIMQTGQRIGTSVGIAVITALAFRILEIGDWPTAFIAGFLGIIVVVTLALVVALADERYRRRQLQYDAGR